MVTKILSLIKLLGGFRLARFLTRNDLRILCYHGFSLRDEHEFLPTLFMTGEAFGRRLDAVIDEGYQVLSLDDALQRRRAGTLPANAVVITIDDGGYGTLVKAVPELARRRLPATMYLTTYHVRHQYPIFGLTLQYLIWKSPRTTIDLSGLGLEHLVPDPSRLAAVDRDVLRTLPPVITLHAATTCSRDERQDLLAAIAARCDVDFAAVNDSRMFHLLDADEVVQASDAGVSVELHTHRHRSWGIEALALEELAENREQIAQITGKNAVHFCYPSGRYDRYRQAWLEAAGVESATTCVPGFVRPSTSPFLLGRFVDNMEVPMILFEAELAGVLELYRRLRRVFARRDEHFVDDPSEGRPPTMTPAGSLQSVAQ